MSSVTVTQTTVVTATVTRSGTGSAYRMTDLLRDEEAERDEERRRHRRDLAPRVDAPPEPAQQVDQSRSGADGEQELERLARGRERTA